MRGSSESGSSTDAARDALEHALAIEALAYLASDETRLKRFLAATGLGPHNLRRAAADSGFLASVLEYLAADDRLLVAFAAESQRKPEEVMAAIHILRGPPPTFEP